MKLTITRKLLLLSLIGLACGGYSACRNPLFRANVSREDVAETEPGRKLVWLSLDALNGGNMAPYLNYIKSPHPRGLKWLLDQQHAQPKFQVSYPSITAPSHISTMTCAAPGTHGVFLNAGNWNGEVDQNGFAMSYATETWVQALRNDHKRVAVAAYPSVDGSSPERSADMGVAYDTPKGKVQYIKVPAGVDAPVQVVSHQTDGKKFDFTLRLKNELEVLVHSDFSGDITLPVGKVIDAFGTDGEGSSSRQAAVSFMNVGVQQGAIVVAVSPMSVMPVTGKALQERLEAKKIVWSNIRDYGFAKFTNGVALTLETLKHRRNIEMAAIEEMIAMGEYDAMFLYFEDIDVIMHAWIGVPELNAQLGEYFAEFDQQLGNLLQKLPSDVNLVVMGDHGMSAVQYELNVRKLIPANTAQYFQIRTSGGTALFYPSGKLDGSIPAELDLQGVAQALREATVEFDGGRKVFKTVVVRDTPDARTLGISGNSSPWIMAFADDQIGLMDRLNSPVLVSKRESFVIPTALKTKYPDPTNSGKLVVPTPLGQHGHDSNLDSMRTHLFLSGPQLDNIDLSQIRSNTAVVPSVATALGWVKPASCQ